MTQQCPRGHPPLQPLPAPLEPPAAAAVAAVRPLSSGGGACSVRPCLGLRGGEGQSQTEAAADSCLPVHAWRTLAADCSTPWKSPGAASRVAWPGWGWLLLDASTAAKGAAGTAAEVTCGGCAVSAAASGSGVVPTCWLVAVLVAVAGAGWCVAGGSGIVSSSASSDTSSYTTSSTYSTSSYPASS